MAISSGRQLLLLMWKNWLLQKRRRALTVFYILLPAIFAFILLLLRMRIHSQWIATPTIFSTVPVPDYLPARLMPLPRGSRWRFAYTPDNNVAARVVNRALRRLQTIPPNSNFTAATVQLPGEFEVLYQFCKISPIPMCLSILVCVCVRGCVSVCVYVCYNRSHRSFFSENTKM